MDIFRRLRMSFGTGSYLRNLIYLTFISLTVSACDGDSIESIEAAAIASDIQGDFDRCEFFGGYSDRVCDADCPSPDPDCSSGDIRNSDGQGPTMCVALRGNGDRIPAHFAALARLYEQYGLLSGVAGGSSAALTALLIESVQKNSAVRCPHCTNTQKGERAALLMKSMRGYMDTVFASEEVLAAQSYASLLAAMEQQGLDEALDLGTITAAEEFQTLLNSERFRSFINPEVFQLLRQSPNPTFHAQDIYRGIRSAAAFDATDPNILVRPGLLNISGLAEQFGRAADFYVETDFEHFLSSCSDRSVGVDWQTIQGLPIASGGTCGSVFFEPLGTYLQRRTPSSQLQQPVGEFMHTLIPTSVLDGQAINVWKDAFAAYKQAQPIESVYDYSDVRFGYFGHQQDLQRVLENRNNYQDEKTRRLTAYGNVTWGEALKYSPAEPGLSRAQILPDGRISAGGWNDLHPVQVLKNLGCDKVVYVTRQGSESGFARGVSRLLGMQPSDDARLFDLSQANSGFSQALDNADGVLCSNWDQQQQLDFDAFFNDAYNAPLQTTDPDLVTNNYFNTRSNLGIKGCTAGAY